MIPLDDSKWKSLHGAYRRPYDASIPLRRLEAGEDMWAELWDNLHHQGRIGEASYAAVPQIVQIVARQKVRNWNPYALVATIEIERHRKSNPGLPDWLNGDYRDALYRLLGLGLNDLSSVKDSPTIQAILGFSAAAKGEIKLGAFISNADTSEIDAHLNEHDAWSEVYRS
jgi:hypothetical protein